MRFLIASLLTLALAVPSAAQTASCDPDDGTVCNIWIDAALELQARLGIAFTGGNPIPGANSTLDLRSGQRPAVSLDLRYGQSDLYLESVRYQGGFVYSEELQPHSLNIDVAVGVLAGSASIGLGSLDLLASYGMVSLPGRAGFVDDVRSWSLGARLGILRESINRPGISMTAVYRQLSELINEQTESSRLMLSNNKVFSLRAIAGDHVFMFGILAGVGYDRYVSLLDARGRITPTNVPGHLRRESFAHYRTNLFVNLSTAVRFIHFVGEVGYQQDLDDKLEGYQGVAVRVVR
jgi:hypothetical protein